MAVLFQRAAQKAVFDTLNGNIAATVYDGAPALPDGMPSANFPFVDIGEATVVAFDTDDTRGVEVTVMLHFWSRKHGMNEINGLMGAVYGLLHQQAITTAGYWIVDVLHEFTSTMKDPEGTLRHGVARYRVTIQET